MDYKAILFEKRDNVAYITLNRPDDANALDLTTAEELHQAALDCDQDEDVRGILITGKGRMFCGGGDLKFFHGSGADVESLLMQVSDYALTLALQQNGCARRHGDQRYGSGRRFQFRDIGGHHTRGGICEIALAYLAAGLLTDAEFNYLLLHHDMSGFGVPKVVLTALASLQRRQITISSIVSCRTTNSWRRRKSKSVPSHRVLRELSAP